MATNNKVWPRPIPAASRPLAKPRRDIRRGIGANFVGEERAPLALIQLRPFIPAAGGTRGILSASNKEGFDY
ncbi:MAG: hypothetical protein ABI430_05225 [Candidatus Taylorbacteria bacterium]